MVDRVGQRLGNYRLLRMVGQGGFADVYLGEHVHLRTQAAIKVLQLRLGENNVQSFLNEARTIAHLVHPYIIRVLDFGVQDNTPFLVMDYAPKGTFRQRFLQGNPLPAPPLFPYVKQAATALQYAHDKKLIHRDVKPENMLIGPNDEVLLSDFGFAMIQSSVARTSSAETAGTAAYMAPEQLQGKPHPASDQYALGIVAYEWLTGHCPFHGTFFEIASQHMLAPPPALHKEVPSISPELEQVVMTALAKDPTQRFASVRAFATALERACLSSKMMQPGLAVPPFIPPGSVSGFNHSLSGSSLPDGEAPNQGTLPSSAVIRTRSLSSSPSHTMPTQQHEGASRSAFPTLDSTGVQRAIASFRGQHSERKPTSLSPSKPDHPPLPEMGKGPSSPPSQTFPDLVGLSPAKPLSAELQVRLYTACAQTSSGVSFTGGPSISDQLLPQQAHNSLTGIRPFFGNPSASTPSGTTFPHQSASTVNASIPGLSALPTGMFSASSVASAASHNAGPGASPNIAQALERRRDGVSNGMVLFLVLMTVFIIGGSIGLISLANSLHKGADGPTTSNLTQTAQHRQQTATTQANAHATAASISTATAQAIANPYQPDQGILTINDPLSSNGATSQWDEDTTTNQCTFTDDSYHARAATNMSAACYSVGQQFDNFTYEISMNFVQTSQAYSSGGIIFRANKDSGQFYLFLMFASGRYLFEKCIGVTNCTIMINGTQTANGDFLDPPASFKVDQPNTLAVTAVSDMLTLYINGQRVFDPWQDTTDNPYTQGLVGVFVHGGTDTVGTDVAYNQARVWK